MPPDSNELQQKLKRRMRRVKQPAKGTLTSLVNPKSLNKVLTKAQKLARKTGSVAADAARQVVTSGSAQRVQSYFVDLHRRATHEQIKASLTESWVWGKSQGTTAAAQLQSWANALLTTEFAQALASWTADTFNKNFDKYDEIIDRIYNAGEGGSSAIHHLVDGSHSLLGAMREASKAYGEDSVFAEVTNTVEHLLRDLAARTGINPIFSLTKDQLSILQDFAGNFGVSKSWVNDFLLINVPEVLGAFFAVVPVWFGWSKLDAEKFADIAGSAGMAALISANPLLGLVALISMARSFNLLLSKEKEAFRRSAGKGGLGAVQVGVVYTASATIAGPQVVGILVGLVVAYAVRRYASTNMTHEEMVNFITQIYTTQILPSISANAQGTLTLFHNLQQRFQFDPTLKPSGNL